MRKLLINLLITLKNVQYVHYVYLVFFCPVCTVEKLYNIYLLYNINKTVHGCTTGTRVWVDSSSRVRIPPSPPYIFMIRPCPILFRAGSFFLYAAVSPFIFYGLFGFHLALGQFAEHFQDHFLQQFSIVDYRYGQHFLCPVIRRAGNADTAVLFDHSLCSLLLCTPGKESIKSLDKSALI